MGAASMLEDIYDRYYETESLSAVWGAHLGPKSAAGATRPRDPVDRAKEMIGDFWHYYRQPSANGAPVGEWQRHFNNLEALARLLAPAQDLDTETPGAWERISGTEKELREYFLSNPFYGPLSRQVIERFTADSKTIRTRYATLVKDLNLFVEASKTRGAAGEAGVQEILSRFAEIRDQMNRDLKECEEYHRVVKQVRAQAERFVTLYRHFAVQARYRPALQHLHRLRLTDGQEGHVARDHTGPYRLQGASGSGKTIILLHRALRLALENPDKQVRVFTVNRSLAELLRSSVEAIHGNTPANLHVSALYEFLLDVLKLFEDCGRYRLVDDRSGERIVHSWNDFFHHRGKNVTRNVFADPGVIELVRYVEGHGGLKVDAHRYLREEMIYVQTGHRMAERWNYTNPQAESRRQRSIGLVRPQRMACLLVLEAWEEWLGAGNLCDVDGLSLKVADYFDSEERRKQIRDTFPTDFILADEVQDFSTLELRMLRQLSADASGLNSIFLVGDLNQKVFAKHHRSGQAGYNFQGKADVLRQNHRNTREILQAAYCLPQEFPPPNEDGLDLADPQLSPYTGGKPVALACDPDEHAETVMEIVRLRRGKRVAVVSENVSLLKIVFAKAGEEGMVCHELFRIEDLDIHRQQLDVLKADLVVSRMEAVKGFEFDMVIVCDLSEGFVPRPGTPTEEYWREAAVVYSALTRARDELVLTYVDQPSLFLKVMNNHLAGGEGADRLLHALTDL